MGSVILQFQQTNTLPADDSSSTDTLAMEGTWEYKMNDEKPKNRSKKKRRGNVHSPLAQTKAITNASASPKNVKWIIMGTFAITFIATVIMVLAVMKLMEK